MSERNHTDGHPGFDEHLHCVCMCSRCEDPRTGYCICPDCDPVLCGMHADDPRRRPDAALSSPVSLSEPSGGSV